jgi:uncharacterized protein
VGAPVAFFDITSSDPARISGFYTQLFDWTVSDGPGGYSMVDTGNGEGAVAGGIGGTQGPDDKTGITLYVRVDDLAAYLAKAEKLGAKTVMPPVELPGGYGSIAVIADPDGNPFGLWA